MITVVTESTYTDMLEKQGWSIKPLNFITLVDPPAVMTSLKSVRTQEGITPGSFELVQTGKTQIIDRLTHESLLEESLAEYKDIWRTLAEK